MWNFKANTIKDFWACNSFFNHLVDAHVLAAIGGTLGATTWDELQVKMKGNNFRKKISDMEKRLGNLGLVTEWRQRGARARDLVMENAVLLLQHGLMYRRFAEAVRSGDTGWVVHCIKYFAIWLQNDSKKASLSNYRVGSLHLMASLTHIWSPEFRRYWMDNCLVNVSGSPTGFVACDLLGEYIVREYKSRINKNINPVNDLHHRNVYGPQIMTAKMVRDHIYEVVGAVQHYQHSSTVNTQTDVQTITRELLRQRVFVETPGCTNYTIDKGRPIDEAIDLFVGVVATPDLSAGATRLLLFMMMM